ncbi:MAG: DNA/RNA non-specific endonuclease [Acidobacteria bacterium]|nr:DNA/RNA non-specific endonuclease [Acidobacteriota bacterium]
MFLNALLLILASALQAQPDRFGLPACSAPTEDLARRTAYVVCHNGDRKVATWTAYELTPDKLTMPAARRPKHFRQDAQLNSASNSDYRNSGYHRGHLVPAADAAWSDDAMRDSFLLSNAAPQIPAVNTGSWRRIENAIRRLAARSDAVVVITGTLFDCAEVERIGTGQVAVPSAMFKVVVAIQKGKPAMFAVVVPNQSTASLNPAQLAVTVREVERLTGLDFFPALNQDDQIALETAENQLP